MKITENDLNEIRDSFVKKLHFEKVVNIFREFLESVIIVKNHGEVDGSSINGVEDLKNMEIEKIV